MRVEIDTNDLVVLVKQFITKDIPDEDILENIEQMIHYPEDEEFSHKVDIVEF